MMRPMRFRPALADIRSVLTPQMLRRAGLVALSGLGLRLLAPALARVLFEQSLVAKLGLGLALSVVFTAHTLLQRAFASRTEADLVERTARAVLEGDVLRSRLASEDEMRAEISQAIFTTSQALSVTLPNFVADVISCAALGLWIALSEPLRLVVLAAGLTLVAALALFFSRGSLERAVARAWRIEIQAYEAFIDILEGRLEVVASGRRKAFLSGLHDRTAAWSQAGVAVAASSALAGRLPMLAIALLVGVALAVSSSIRSSVAVTLADLAVFASVSPAFAAVAQGIHGFTKAERWIGVVARVLRAVVTPAGGGRLPGDLAGRGISFQEVSFRYEGQDQDALRNVSFACRRACTLALTGPNGSGKSTCLRLLLALGKARGGRILIGDEPLENLEPDAWRRRVAFLPQRPYLPPRSEVQQTIRWLAPGSTDDRIVQSLDRVGILGSLRRGGRNPLAITVDRLSVGERQRVALARLLCHDAALFVLDEPDANLDRAGIVLVAGILRDLARQHMVVVAAHTPELLAVADHVVSLEDGGVVRDSAPADALDRFSPFAAARQAR